MYAITITIIFCLFGILRNEFGFSDLKTCSLEHNKSIRIVYNIFLLINVAAIWSLLLYSWKNIKINSSLILFQYCLVVISVSLTISITVIMDFLTEYSNQNQKTYSNIGIVFGSLTGSCIAIARLSNKSLLRKLRTRIFVRKSMQFTDSMLSMLKPEETITFEATILSEFFENITTEVIN